VLEVDVETSSRKPQETTMFRTKSLALVFSLALPLAAAAVPTFASSTARAEAAAEGARTTMAGTFQRYLLMPNGKTFGLMLSDGTFVHTPGHALSEDAPALATGTRLDIEGVVRKTPTGTIVQRAVVKLGANVIADASHANGHRKHHDGERGARGEHKHQALQPVSGAGQIAAIVSGPRGRVQAFVLTDGTTVMAHGVDGFGLKVGDRITVAGQGGTYARGKSLRIEKITLPNGQTRDVPRPERHHKDPSQAPT
jgi:hypothetical protein